jgi:hypothetical protein
MYIFNSVSKCCINIFGGGSPLPELARMILNSLFTANTNHIANISTSIM